MKTAEQILEDVEESFGCCGDYTAIIVDDKVYSCDKVIKHRNGTIEFRNCCQVDETCYEPNGEYLGEVLEGAKTFILKDSYPKKRQNCFIELYSQYYTKEAIVREIKQRKYLD
jgi:hypothetical protein